MSCTGLYSLSKGQMCTLKDTDHLATKAEGPPFASLLNGLGIHSKSTSDQPEF